MCLHTVHNIKQGTLPGAFNEIYVNFIFVFTISKTEKYENISIYIHMYILKIFLRQRSRFQY